MSLFLGKIHYWLFNKIVWFEELESEIITLSKSEGIDVEKLKAEIENKHGERTPNKPLEDMIDTGNIHGWLQSKIHSAEGRMAAWTKVVLDNDKENGYKKLEEVYRVQGVKAANELKENTKIETAPDMFNAINDYILDGMPCDRVNEVVANEENKVEWVRRICVHKDIWEAEGVDVSVFYDLRSIWIESFVSNVNSEFEYVEQEELKIVRRK